MGIPDIDFTRIRSLGPGGQRDGYEQLICRQVAQEPPMAGATFVSLHGAGGDGAWSATGRCRRYGARLADQVLGQPWTLWMSCTDRSGTWPTCPRRGADGYPCPTTTPQPTPPTTTKETDE